VCNGYVQIQIAQFKLKENEEQENKWILYIDSVVLSSYDSPAVCDTQAMACVLHKPSISHF